MFHISILSPSNVDTFRLVKFETSLSCTSIDIHTCFLPKEVDTPISTSIPLWPDIPSIPSKTIIAEPQITLPLLPQQSGDYEQFLDEDSELQRVPNEHLTSLSTPLPHVVLTPSTPGSSCRKNFSKVADTHKLAYKSYPKGSTKSVACYSESGRARLITEPNS